MLFTKTQCDNEGAWDWFVRFMDEYGVEGSFCGKIYKYLYWGEYRYWMMDPTPEECDLINRCIIPDDVPFLLILKPLCGSLTTTEDILGTTAGSFPPDPGQGPDTEQTFKVTLDARNTLLGNVKIDNGAQSNFVEKEVAAGSTVQISAIPELGVLFVKWSDDDTNAVRTISVNEDLTLRPTFEEGPDYNLYHY